MYINVSSYRSIVKRTCHKGMRVISAIYVCTVCSVCYLIAVVNCTVSADNLRLDYCVTPEGSNRL